MPSIRETRESLSSTYAALTNHRRGSGSPLSVVTPAAVGEVYADTAQTNGARLWINTGTANTSWTVLDGDTGRRNVASLISANWDTPPNTSAEHLILRRSGAMVTLTGRIKASAVLNGAARATGALILAVPAGFVYSEPYLPTGIVQYGSATLGFVATSSSSGMSVTIPGTGNYATGDFITLQARWNTTQAWPTTLPGTAA